MGGGGVLIESGSNEDSRFKCESRIVVVRAIDGIGASQVPRRLEVCRKGEFEAVELGWAKIGTVAKRR